MLRRVSVAAIAVCLMFVFIQAGWSQESKKQAATKEPAAKTDQTPNPVLGDVVKVDQKAKTMNVKTKGGEKKFDISNASLAGYNSIKDIKAGDKIAVLYEEKDGKLVAKTVANHATMMKMGQPK